MRQADCDAGIHLHEHTPARWHFLSPDCHGGVTQGSSNPLFNQAAEGHSGGLLLLSESSKAPKSSAVTAQTAPTSGWASGHCRWARPVTNGKVFATLHHHRDSLLGTRLPDTESELR